ncbi:MAG: hypothetical protein HDR05_05520 [Lachnospiraceae bacterium]|nr:hypothetical protein [Lachnospiraceae bacterium]
MSKRKTSNKLNKSNNYLKIMYYLFTRKEEEKYSFIIDQVNIKDKDVIKKEMLREEITKFNNRMFVYSEGFTRNMASMYLEWYFHIFEQELSFYIKTKVEYEKCMYLNQSEKAEELLKQIEKKCGISTWSIGQRFLLLENRGIEYNKKYLSELSEVLKPNVILSILLSYLSMSAEKKMSYIGYKNKIRDLDNFGFLKDYFIFKLDLFLDKVDDSFFTKITQIDSQISIIDTYESIIRYIQLQYSSGLEIKSILKCISVFDKDYRIRNLIIATMKVDFNYFESICNESVLQCMDNYTMGKYNKVIDFLKVYLLEFPMDFQMITIYIKSHIYTNTEMVGMSEIYMAIYHIYKMDEMIKDSKDYLLLHAKRYMDEVSIKIYSFIQRHFGQKSDEFYFRRSLLNDYNITPSFYLLHRNEMEKVHLLDFVSKYAYNTAQLFKYLLGNEKELSNQCIIQDKRRTIFESIIHINNLESDQAIDKLEILQKKISEKQVLEFEKVNRYLFIAYEGNKEYIKMLKLYVNCFFINPSLINRFHVSALREKVRFTHDAEIKKSIEYPIFIYLYNSNDKNSVKIAYLNYLDANYIINSEDFLKFVEKNLDDSKYVFFFVNICTIEIMKKDTRFLREKIDIENLRVSILRKFVNMQLENTSQYLEEIALILSNKLIRKRKMQFEQNRIFADIKAIRMNYDTVFKEQFMKYCEIGEFGEELIEIDYSDFNSVSLNHENLWTDPVSIIKENQRYILIKTLLKRIQHEFLKGDGHGLNYYLSTRIRHGYCDSKLTKAFQDVNLLLLKEKDDSVEYTINPYWDRILPKNSKYSEEIKVSLSHFSKKIGNKINQVKKEWLTIKEKHEEKGLLDYTFFVDTCLELLNKGNTDYNIFIDWVERMFWDYTEIRLNEIRTLINTDLKDYFYQQLAWLEKELSSISGDNRVSKYLNQLLYDIKGTRPKLVEKLNEFSDVLYKQDIIYEDFDINAVIEVVMDIQRSINADFSKIKITQQVDVTEKFKGKFFPHFVDVLNIFIDNAFKRSGITRLEEMEISIEVTSNVDVEEYLESMDIDKITEENFKKWMQIMVLNKLHINVDKDNVWRKVKEILDNVSNSEIIKEITQKEGGTGLYKVCNTLKYHFDAVYGIFYGFQKEYFFITIILGYDNLIAEE